MEYFFNEHWCNCLMVAICCCLVKVEANFVFGEKAGRSEIESGGELRMHSRLYSPNGRIFLIMQDDSNAVVYDTWRCEEKRYGTPGGYSTASKERDLWATMSIYGHNRPTAIKMQTDGNLVMYSGSGQLVWSSRTGGGAFAGAVLYPILCMSLSVCVSFYHRFGVRRSETDLFFSCQKQTD